MYVRGRNGFYATSFWIERHCRNATLHEQDDDLKRGFVGSLRAVPPSFSSKLQCRMIKKEDCGVVLCLSGFPFLLVRLIFRSNTFNDVDSKRSRLLMTFTACSNLLSQIFETENHADTDSGTDPIHERPYRGQQSAWHDCVHCYMLDISLCCCCSTIYISQFWESEAKSQWLAHCCCLGKCSVREVCWLGLVVDRTAGFRDALHCLVLYGDPTWRRKAHNLADRSKGPDYGM